MDLKIITRKGLFIEKQVDSVILPSLGGEMEVLKGHAETVAMISSGKVVYDGSFTRVEDGFAYVGNDTILVIVKGVAGAKGFQK